MSFEVVVFSEARSRRVFAFPDPVNEVSARLVAGGVAIISLATIVSGFRWLAVAIAYGFVARAIAGPTFSPLGQRVSWYQGPPDQPTKEQPSCPQPSS